MKCWFCRFRGKDSSDTFKHMWAGHRAKMPTGNRERPKPPAPINPLMESVLGLLTDRPVPPAPFLGVREAIRDEIGKQFERFNRTIEDAIAAIEESDRKALLAPKKPAMPRFSFTLFGFTISR